MAQWITPLVSSTPPSWLARAAQGELCTQVVAGGHCASGDACPKHGREHAAALPGGGARGRRGAPSRASPPPGRAPEPAHETPRGRGSMPTARRGPLDVGLARAQARRAALRPPGCRSRGRSSSRTRQPKRSPRRASRSLRGAGACAAEIAQRQDLCGPVRGPVGRGAGKVEQSAASTKPSVSLRRRVGWLFATRTGTIARDVDPIGNCMPESGTAPRVFALGRFDDCRRGEGRAGHQVSVQAAGAALARRRRS